MSTQVIWRLEGRIIYVKLSGVVTIEELVETANTIAALIPAEDNYVHTIADMRDMSEFPKQIKHLAAVIPQLRRGSGWLLLVTQNIFFRFLATTIATMASRHMRVFDDPQAALDYLQQADDSLPPLGVDIIPGDEEVASD